MNSAHSSCIQPAGRIIVKVGSSLVTNEGRGLDHEAIARWATQIAALRGLGKEVVLVSSGAIAEGMLRLGFSTRPHDIHELQACAAVGQMGLAQIYESSFATHGVKTAQVLLTHADLADRERYLNARATLTTLLRLGVVPIINENDTVVTDEIKFGDNDTLGALVANLIEADALVILTDQRGLFSSDPRKDPAARLIAQAEAGDPALEAMAGGAGSSIGRGGMLTKVLAVAQESNRDDSKPRVVNAVTLELAPDQVEKLDLARSIGSLSLVLRNQVDPQPANTAGATRESVLGLPEAKPAPAPVAAPAPARVVRAAPAPVQPRPAAPRNDGVLVIRGLDAAPQAFN